jgi:hypothetical protein
VGTELVEGRRVAADELVEPRIGEHLDHHVRLAGGRRRQGVQWLGAKLPLLNLLGSKGHLTLGLWCRDGSGLSVTEEVDGRP